MTDSEAQFITARDPLYEATVGESGWPFIQHWGGRLGFVRVMNRQTIGLADLRGNGQDISFGNLVTDDCVSLFFMD